GYFVSIILTRSEFAGDDVAPQTARQRTTQKRAGHRIGIAHHTLPINHHHTARQKIEQALQAQRQTLLLGQLLETLRASQGQLTTKLRYALFKKGTGVA